jgi:transposase-like protein
VTYDARKCESAVGGPASNPQNQTEFAACKKFLGTESERFSDYSEEVNGRQNLPQGSQNLPQRR